jgi:hypothetical protein
MGGRNKDCSFFCESGKRGLVGRAEGVRGSAAGGGLRGREEGEDSNRRVCCRRRRRGNVRSGWT